MKTVHPRVRRFVLSTGILIALVALTVSSAAAGLAPATATFTIAPGGSATETKTITVPATPPKADIEIAIDTTGSMEPTIAQAKADAITIVNGVQASVPDTQFAVVQFKDFGFSPEYQVEQAMTSSAASVQAAISGLSAGGGGDAPEEYNLVFHNSYTPATGGDIGWRAGTRKFVVVIGDAQPHGDVLSQGFAGCVDEPPDPEGLVTKTELGGMKTAERTLLMIRQIGPRTSTTLQCYQSLAAAAFTGGQAIDGGGSLAGDIISLINAAFASVGDVHLEVVSAAPAPAAASWITFNPASLGPVAAPSTQKIDLTVTVPSATPGGTYKFDIKAVADGVDIGHQALTVVVNSPPDCSGVTLSPNLLWPPNHKLVTVTATGAVDPDSGDSATLVITAVTQDEPVNGLGDGDTSPDAFLTSPVSNTVQIRAERSGTGDGRVYRLVMTATDTHGATCTVRRTVGVPHDQGKGSTPVDSAPPSYDSTLP